MSGTTYRLPANSNPEIKTDRAAGAVYAKLSDKPFARTVLARDDEIVVTLDLAADDEVIGIEVIGGREHSLAKIMELTGMSGHE